MIVETGLGITGANSYLSVEEADAYHATYNQLDWAGSDADKEVALINATKSVDLLYGELFLSAKLLNPKNSLLFPRYPFYDLNNILISATTIPTNLKDAVAEIALMYLMGDDIFPKPSTEGYQQNSKIEIDVIKFDTTFSATPPTERYTGFNKIDLLLKPIIKKNTYPQLVLYR